jgi:DUF4097 and DUF4098 domain-containing protein YvlB
MRAHIQISIPRRCPINLSNKFGKAKLEHLDAPITLNGYFCRFDLYALSGKLQIESEHGPIEGRELNGTVDIKGKRADVTLYNPAGDCVLMTEYGTVNLYTDQQSGNVRITGQMTNITLNGLDTIAHNYRLKTHFGNMDVPQTFDRRGGADKDFQASYQATPNSPTIDVETTLGHIKVEH